MCIRTDLFYAASVREVAFMSDATLGERLERLTSAMDAALVEARRRRRMNHKRTFAVLAADLDWAMPTLRGLCAERDRREARKVIRAAKESGLLDCAG